MRLGYELTQGDPGEDQNGTRGGTKAETFACKDEGRDPRKYGLKCKQKSDMRGWQNGLCPALDRECRGGRQGCRIIARTASAAARS